MMSYQGFTDWNDVQKNFEMDEAEPDEVLLALYDGLGYEGDATVLYRRGEKYFIAEGSHCSCYGLEGQWSPTEFDSRDEFFTYLAGRKDYGEKAGFIKAIVALQK